MRTIDPARSALLVIDFQKRLMPVIHEADAAIANAGRLIEAARLLGIPVAVTEQNPQGLGTTVDELPVAGAVLVEKMEFDASRATGFFEALGDRTEIVVAGCEAHVCVLQTVLGLLDAGGRRIHVARDAIGSRRPENREAALARMAGHGAEIVTAEMVVFEWLQTARHPRFREAMALIK